MPSNTETPDLLPFFVYGTLRPGYGNSRGWVGRARAVHDGDATVDGFRLAAPQYGGFPYAIPAEGSRIVGALIFPEPGEYAAVLYRLDQLEGYPNHYDRIRVRVETPDGWLWAWIYTPPAADLKDGYWERMATVPGGDWNRHNEEPEPWPTDTEADAESDDWQAVAERLAVRGW